MYSDASLLASRPTGPQPRSRKRTFGTLAVVLCLLAAGALLVQSCAATVSRNGYLVVYRTRPTATLLDDGRVLIVGGIDERDHALASAEIYDPVARTFSLTGSMSTARATNSATLLQDGRVLIVGGWGDSRSGLASAELFDPKAGAFTSTGSMATPHANHTATLLPSGEILIAGGTDTGARVTAEVYDPKTGSFHPTGPMVLSPRASTATRSSIATLLRNGTVLIAGGGDDGDWLGTNFAQTYDPRTGEFKVTGPMINARSGHTASLLPDGQVLIVGGSGAHQSSESEDSIELYDPSTGVFALAGSMRVARSYHTATTLNDGRVLIVGGVSGPDVIRGNLASADIYDPKSATFTPTGSLPFWQSDQSATLLTDGRVLIAGGDDYRPAQIYDPKTGEFASAGQ